MADRARTGIILVVDDQESIRALLRRQLGDRGHTVLETGDGAQALHLVRRRNGEVDLILSDVAMPQMNGTELTTRIGVEFPDIPVILMSQNPFDPERLADLVALALRHPVSPRAEARTPAR